MEEFHKAAKLEDALRILYAKIRNPEKKGAIDVLMGDFSDAEKAGLYDLIIAAK